jgi:hypothetical protein
MRQIAAWFGGGWEPGIRLLGAHLAGKLAGEVLSTLELLVGDGENNGRKYCAQRRDSALE